MIPFKTTVKKLKIDLHNFNYMGSQFYTELTKSSKTFSPIPVFELTFVKIFK